MTKINWSYIIPQRKNWTYAHFLVHMPKFLSRNIIKKNKFLPRKKKWKRDSLLFSQFLDWILKKFNFEVQSVLKVLHRQQIRTHCMSYNSIQINTFFLEKQINTFNDLIIINKWYYNTTRNLAHFARASGPG